MIPSKSSGPQLSDSLSADESLSFHDHDVRRFCACRRRELQKNRDRRARAWRKKFPYRLGRKPYANAQYMAEHRKMALKVMGMVHFVRWDVPADAVDDALSAIGKSEA